MEREKKNVQAKMKNESIESRNAMKVQEDMGLKGIFTSEAVAYAILDGRQIEIEDNGSGSNTILNVFGKIGADGASAGIQINIKKVSKKKIIIHR